MAACILRSRLGIASTAACAGSGRTELSRRSPAKGHRRAAWAMAARRPKPGCATVTDVALGPDGSVYIAHSAALIGGPLSRVSAGSSRMARSPRWPAQISGRLPCGDGGPATAARLWEPCLDCRGPGRQRLHQRPRTTSRLRRVGPDGIINTVAGIGQGSNLILQRRWHTGGPGPAPAARPGHRPGRRAVRGDRARNIASAASARPCRACRSARSPSRRRMAASCTVLTFTGATCAR